MSVYGCQFLSFQQLVYVRPGVGRIVICMRMPMNVKISCNVSREVQSTHGPCTFRDACSCLVAAYLFVSNTSSFQNSSGRNARNELRGLRNRLCMFALIVDRFAWSYRPRLGGQAVFGAHNSPSCCVVGAPPLLLPREGKAKFMEVSSSVSNSSLSSGPFFSSSSSNASSFSSSSNSL